jgi:hypothetical protein
VLKKQKRVSTEAVASHSDSGRFGESPMCEKPAVEQDKIIQHYLRRIARLECGLRKIRDQASSQLGFEMSNEAAWNTILLAADTLSEVEEI